MATETKSTLEAENTELHARVEELEAKVKSHSKETHRRSESRKLRENTLDDMADEATKLLRATAHAFAEELRAAADVVKVVADEASKRRDERAARDEKATDVRFSDIEDDVAGVLNKGIEKCIATPRRVIDKFHEVYREPVSK